MFAILVAASYLAGAGIARAGDGPWTPLQVSVARWLQLCNEKRDVIGLRIGVVSENKNVYGLDIGGLMTGVKDRMVGIQVSFSNGPGYPYASSTPRSLQGLQISGFNQVRREVQGAQVGFCNMCEFGNMTGLQVGCLMNLVNEDMVGVQLAALNYSGSEALSGLQIGGWNVATHVRGMQIGAINYCEELSGIQIGAINIATKSTVPFLPLINCSF